MTSAALFRAKNLYREEVRAEMMQTQLDDRHDILGNTIYRLAFDATVLAGNRADSLAGIKITLSHNPEMLEAREKEWSEKNGKPLSKDERQRLSLLSQQYDEDYRQLYFDWARQMQALINEGSLNLTNATFLHNPDPGTKLSFSRFLIGRICEFLLNNKSLGKTIDDNCYPEKVALDLANATAQADIARLTQLKSSAEENRKSAEYLVSHYIKSHVDFVKRIYDAQVDASLQGAIEQRLFSAEDLPYFRELVRQTCRYKSTYSGFIKVTLQELGLKPTARNGTAVPPSESFATGSQAPADSADSIPCLPNVADDEPTWAGIYLYDTLYLKGLAEKRDRQEGSAVNKTKESGDPVLNFLNITRDKENCPRDADKAIVYTRCFFPARDMKTIRCFIADFLRANLNAFDRPAAEPWQRLDTFLNVTLVGREVGDCGLQVSALEPVKESLAELKYRLNIGTEAFAYSETPKNLSENINTSAEIRDAFDMLARLHFNGPDVDAESILRNLRSRSDEIQAIVEHPIVVGFSSGRQSPEPLIEPEGERFAATDPKKPTIRKMNFGWVIAPRNRGVQKSEQIDQQYPLTVVISVPSWWRSIELDIETCWLPRSDVNKIARTDDGDIQLCKSVAEKPNSTVVRLPGVVEELSRKLGFEVLQEPNLTGVQDLPELQIGQPGSLVLMGMRLWRGTEVTLGTQQASSIVVLPNMKGIIAKFDCVLPNLGSERQKLDISGMQAMDAYGVPIYTSDAEVRVWTSEGVTKPLPVKLRWPGRSTSVTEVPDPKVVAARERMPKWCPPDSLSSASDRQSGNQ